MFTDKYNIRNKIILDEIFSVKIGNVQRLFSQKFNS